MSPISTLSGGEQCKVKICILSAKECNFLILDEIVNHLDVTSKDVLKEQLKLWEGGIILVSHEDSFYKD
jgi:ATPase subunit of ABC transporter with duplicated ATPase domains